jgi:hypothetical protein
MPRRVLDSCGFAEVFGKLIFSALACADRTVHQPTADENFSIELRGFLRHDDLPSHQDRNK